MSGEARRPSKRRRISPTAAYDDDPRRALRRGGIDLIRRLEDRDKYGIFHYPVPDDVPDYKKVIAYPMDLSTVRRNLTAGIYETIDQLRSDVSLIWSNCIKFNGPDTIYTRTAQQLREYARRLFADLSRSLQQSQQSQHSSTEPLSKPPIPKPKPISTPISTSPPPPPPTTASPTPSLSKPTFKKPRREKNIFLGPVIKNTEQAQAQYHVLSERIRARLEKPPRAWLELGRRHRKASVPPILTAERQAEVAYGKAYQNFVTSSAPVAKRILALVLDPDMVQRHDRMGGMDADEEDVLDYDSLDDEFLDDEFLPTNERIANDVDGGETKSLGSDVTGFEDVERKLSELIGKKRAAMICKGNVKPIAVPPSAIMDLNKALVEQEMDASFMATVLNRTAEFVREAKLKNACDTKKMEGASKLPPINGGRDGIDDFPNSLSQEKQLLLDENYNLIQEMRRLRAVAEGDLTGDDRKATDSMISKVSNGLLANLRLLAEEYSPKMLTNPIDVSHAGQVLIESILNEETKSNVKVEAAVKKELVSETSKLEPKKKTPLENGVGSNGTKM